MGGDYVKCNLDAAIFIDIRYVRIGFCLRNSVKQVLAAAAATEWKNGI